MDGFINFKPFLERFGAYSQNVHKFPEMPVLDWIKIARPEIDGEPYSFQAYPMWNEIYENEAYQLMVMAGRQVFKTTWLCNLLAHMGTSYRNSTGCYVTYDDISLNAMSTQKFREQTLNDNPVLRSMCAGKKTGAPGTVHQVQYLDGSFTYLSNDEGGFNHIEGRTPNIVVIDEAQYCEMEYYSKIKLAQTTSVTSRIGAKIRIAAIGGEEGSEIWKKWKETTQSEWVYRDKYWYDKLKFDRKGKLILGKYLEKVLDGKWVMNEPRNRDFPGYWLPQTIFPHIPQKIIHAINRHLPIEHSVEYKKLNDPQTIFQSHTMGSFYKAQRRPITPEMIKDCMRPYPYLSLVDPNKEEINGESGLLQSIHELKETFGKQIKILYGVDFGSGKSGLSSTIPMILCKWIPQNNIGQARYQLLWVEKRPSENADDQAEYLTWLFKVFGCDIGTGDLGYGADRVKKMQLGGHNRKSGIPWTGLGDTRFIGVRSVSKEEQAIETREREFDEHGDKSERIMIDKTQTLDNYVSFIQWRVSHPKYPKEDALRRPKLMIPSSNESNVHWMINDMSALVRKDLEEVIDIEVVDERQHAKKEYNHPKDVIMSTCYCLVADEQEEPSTDVGGIFKKGKPHGGTPYGRNRLR